jgi:hypothetical protein
VFQFDEICDGNSPIAVTLQKMLHDPSRRRLRILGIPELLVENGAFDLIGKTTDFSEIGCGAETHEECC